MDIKLRARLSAYSKIESVAQSSSGTPIPDSSNAGSLVGVSKDGEYTLYSTVSKHEIDSLFMDVVPDDVVTKDQIDSLFPNTSNNGGVPSTPTDENRVTFEDIDKLFK